MLVNIYHGNRIDDSILLGDMYFDSRPCVGDRAEIKGKFCIVRQAWHIPSDRFAGAKFSILVSNAAPENLSADDYSDATSRHHDAAARVV